MTKTLTRKRKTAAAPAETTGPRASPRPDSKKAQLIARLEDPLRVDVATPEQRSWQPHSTRAALTGLRKDGYTIERLPSEPEKKGLWMGGLVPLGYDAAGRALAVNHDEAASVRTLFDLYLEPPMPTRRPGLEAPDLC